jgi:hypothetical protein
VKSWRTSELRPRDAHPSRGIVDLTLDAEIIGTAEGGARRAFAAREYLSADDLLIPDNLRNGGRRRPWIPVGLGDNLDDDESDLAARSRRDRPTSLDYEGLQAVDWLADGGWHVREDGSTGLPAHRPAKGIRGADLIRQRIDQLAPGFRYESAAREERADLVVRLLAKPRPVNRQALADFWNVDRSTITRLNSLGKKRLHQNSAKGGGAVSSA